MHITNAGFDPKTGKAFSLSFAGPVTPENVSALRELFKSGGHQSAAEMLKPGMIATYSIDPQTGKGTFHATDNTSTQSEDFGEKTIHPEKGLTVDTPHGSFRLKAGKIQEVGGQVYINGTTEDDKHIQLKGVLTDAYKVTPGWKRMEDGTSRLSTDPDAALYELQTKPSDSGKDGGLRSSLISGQGGL